MKKIGYIILSISILFSYTSVFAYEYYNKSNEGNVNSHIIDIYDRVEMYDFLAGEKEEENDLEYTTFGNDQMWWPIGSDETTTVNGKKFATGNPASFNMSSSFGWRTIGGKKSHHNGIDITGIYRKTNVIATKAGTVTKVVDGFFDNQNSAASNLCSQANYIKILHDDGTQSYYWHLGKNSITVDEGERVEQGQVIGLMASSGCSTGPHLHFEIHDQSGNPVDPLKYVDTKNPRPIGTSEQFLKSLQHAEVSYEASYCDKEKKYYKVHNVSNEPNNTVGYGVYLDSDKIKAIEKYGGDSSKTKVGDCILVSAVDNVMLLEANTRRKEVQNMAKSNKITLKQHEEDALVIHLYQTGNGNLAKTKEFASIYKSSTDVKDLGDFFMKRHDLSGVRKRRCYVWKLYHKGIYFPDKSPFNDTEDNACSNLY